MRDLEMYQLWAEASNNLEWEPMTDVEVDALMAEIERYRARNNKHFMKMWRLAFKHFPEEAKKIQRDIREGDLEISRLNGLLCK